MRRLPSEASRESYLAADAEAGLLDLHLLGANDLSREVILLLSTVAHPNLARLRDAGVVDGEIYLVEDHIDGVPLDELARIGRLPGDVSLHLIAAVASALAEAEQVVKDQQQLVVCVPRLDEIFVSSVGQIKMGLAAVIGLQSSLETLIETEGAEAAVAMAQAAGRTVARRAHPAYSPLAGLGAMVAKLLGPPWEDDDLATRAARELGETARQGIGAPGDCRVLHGMAVAALRQTARTPTGGFVSGKLSDLVERLAPRCGTDEAELAAAGALLVAALPDGTPAAGEVRSFYAALDAPAGVRAGSRPHLAPIGAHTLGQNLQGTPYRLVRKLGVGGMGIVFEAEHTDLNRRVAIKVLHGALNRDPQVLARFKQEARSAARIRHPHIVEIYDFGTTSAGEVFLVMELLSGQNLARLCRSGRLPPWRSLDILRQVCEGVEAAHQAGVIHRDLKPDNVMVTPLGRPTRPGTMDLVKVLDFGIAKLRDLGGPLGLDEPRAAITRQGQLFGTPEYMAPEQILGGTTDHRVDIYSLGCIAYEVLTGDLPFPGDNYGKMLASHLKDLPVPIEEQVPGLPPELSDVVLRAMAKDPDERYASMAEFGEALLAVSDLVPPPEAGVIVVPMSDLPRSAPISATRTPSARNRLSANSATGNVSAVSVGRSSRQLTVPVQAGASAQTVPVQPSAPVSRRRRMARPVVWGACGALLGLCGVFLWIASQPRTGPREDVPAAGTNGGSAIHSPSAARSIARSEAERRSSISASSVNSQREAPVDPPITLTSEPTAGTGTADPPSEIPPLRLPLPLRPATSPASRLALLSARPTDPRAAEINREAPQAPRFINREAPQAPRFIDRPDRAPKRPEPAPGATLTASPASPPSAATPTTAAPAEVTPRAPTPEAHPVELPARTPSATEPHPSAETRPASDSAHSGSPVAPGLPGLPGLIENRPVAAHVEAAVPATRPAAAPPRPTFTNGKLSYTVLGTTSAYGRRDASSGLDSTRRALETCYRRAVTAAPGDPPRGDTTLSFSVDEDGHFVHRSTATNGPAVPIRPCLEAALHQARFPHPEIGPVTITIRLTLEPLP